MSCGCKSCAQNQTCQNTNTPSNITVTTIEQDENHAITLITYELNGTTYEVSITQTLLWSYSELTDEINRTASFISTEITAQDMSMQSYSLSYEIQHEEYNLTVYTTLMPLDLETYSNSLTIINYAPAGKYEITSMEFVEFNSSITLSQQYTILSKVAKEVGKVYEKSEDKPLIQLAESYYTMEEEAKYLSKLVEKQLQEYNREILKSSAVLIDDECGFVCGTICGLMGLVACTLIAGAYCTFYAWICYPICTFAWSAGCAVACSWACSGFQYVSPCDVGCDVWCGVFAAAICDQLGWLGGGICEILSIPVCEGICWGVCG